MGEQQNTISIQVGNKKRNVLAPETWDDLDLRTLILFYSTLFSNLGDEFTAAPFTVLKLISMTRHLLKLTDAELTQWEADCIREDAENGESMFAEELRAVIHATLGGLFDAREDETTGATLYSCRLNLTKNPYPSLSHTPKGKKPGKSTWLFCAQDGLSNITIYELSTLFTYFEQYQATGDEQWGNRLLGVLYRPAKTPSKYNLDSGYEGDRRQPLRRYESKVEDRAELVAKMPLQVRRLIIFWFASCRQQIVERYSKVFRKNGNAGESQPGYGWGGVMLAIAGGPTGLDAIADQHYSNALTWLSMKEDEREAAEQQLKEAKRKK